MPTLLPWLFWSRIFFSICINSYAGPWMWKKNRFAIHYLLPKLVLSLALYTVQPTLSETRWVPTANYALSRDTSSRMILLPGKLLWSKRNHLFSCMAPKTKIVVIGASYGPDIWHSCLGEDGCFDKRQGAKHEGWGRLSSLWSLWVDGSAMNLHLSRYIYIYICTYNPKPICKW